LITHRSAPPCLLLGRGSAKPVLWARSAAGTKERKKLDNGQGKAYIVVPLPMSANRPFKILASILAFLLTGGMVPQALADCTSPCCDPKRCYLDPKPTRQDVCHSVDGFTEQINSTSCNMHKGASVGGTQETCLTASRALRPVQVVDVVPSYERGSLSNLFEGPVRRPLNLARAAPETLYLQNLTLLI
jgi:hypothetical protein